jgi:hypothetical protein
MVLGCRSSQPYDIPDCGTFSCSDDSECSLGLFLRCCHHVRCDLYAISRDNHSQGIRLGERLCVDLNHDDIVEDL